MLRIVGSLALVLQSMSVVVCAAACMYVAGCGGASVGPETPQIDLRAPTTLYPMEEGAQWVYDVDTGGGEPPTLGIFEVIAAAGAERQIANNRGMDAQGRVSHAEPMIYQITSEGIRSAAGGWLLRAPIAEGAEWEAPAGRTAHVTDLEASVEVMAGSWEHCVVVEETGGDDGRVIRTTYCPQVGPVIIASSMSTELTMQTVSTEARLRSYDPGDGSM